MVVNIVKIGIRINVFLYLFHFSFGMIQICCVIPSLCQMEWSSQIILVIWPTAKSTWSHLQIGWWAGSDSSCFPDGSETIIYWFIPLFSGLIDHWWNVQVSFLCTPIHIDCIGLLLFNRDLMERRITLDNGLCDSSSTYCPSG